jgi:asparagine synthase (glutamine-hydrolysing)
MCGIVGVYNFRSGQPVDREILEGMTDLLRHRGPDDRGFLFRGPLALGMRRLSIIDLEHGAQPISNEDGSLQIVFNGEIYNHNALRRELSERGHRFKTRSDTEVIVHGYEEFGTGILDRLNGMFGLALWDGRLGRLFLARDRLGIKPLYYAETPSGIAFASELRALLPWPEIQRELDPAALEQYFAWGFIPAPRSPFRSIRKLGAAMLLLADPAGVREDRYWSLRPGAPITRLGEAEEGLRWHLERAVKLQMQADVPVGAFLSGGVDSSGVVATLDRLRGDAVHTFSIGFPEAGFDETPHARRVARAFSTRHDEETFSPDCLDLIQEVADHLDEPFADDAVLPTYQLSRLARRKVKVVLSGDGGDEIFGGYDHYKADRVAAWYERIPAEIRRGLGRWAGAEAGEKVPKRSGVRRRLRRLEEVLAHPRHLEHARWMIRDTGFLSPDLTGARGIEPRNGWAEPMGEVFRESAFGPGLTRQMEVDLRTFLADGMLFKVDRATMAASLEARVPYLDHELVEFAFRIPERWKLRGLRGKWILRRALGDRLPAGILRRRKSGFEVPVGSWLRGELRDLAMDLLSPRRLKEQGFFRDEAVGAMLREHLSLERDHTRPLWGLLMFQLWRDRFTAGSPHRIPAEGEVPQAVASSGAAADSVEPTARRSH